MKVKELIELLQRCPPNDIVLAECDAFEETASVEDVFVGGGTVKGICYVKLEADEWNLEIDKIKFERNAAQNEAGKNRGETAHWIDVSPLRHIDHPMRECSRCGRRFGRAVSYDMHYCSWCGRKIEGVADEEQE